MTLNVGKELAALERMSVGALRERYAELFKETTAARNRRWLIKRIVWRMQSLEEGGLSDRARERAQELAQRSDLRVTAPKDHQPVTETAATTKTVACRIADGSRTPLPGTLITRAYKGRKIQVQVLTNGFEFEGEVYRSLSAVAKQITGSHWNGFKFFNLPQPGDH